MADIKNLDRIVPLWINEAAQTVSTAGALPVTTSTVKVNPGSGSVNYTLPNGTFAGQLITITNINASNNDAVITPTTAFDADIDVVTLANDGHSVLYMWNGSSWVTLKSGGVGTVA